jgi:hypothetical protein
MSWKQRRIPEEVLKANQAVEYLRVNPYPVQDIVAPLANNDLKITKKMKIITIGSCFAQALYNWLGNNGYNRLPHKWGVVYTPKNIYQIISYSVDPASWAPLEKFWYIDGKYYDPYRKSDDHTGAMFIGDTESKALNNLKNHYLESGNLFKKADVVVFTYGLTELWQNIIDNKAFYAIPFPEVYDSSKHEFYNLTYNDVYTYTKYIVDLLSEFNTNIKILFSVSPVPISVSFREHIGPYIATQYSKSVLHAVVLRIVEEYKNVYYMPSYEIVRSNPLKYYKEDGRHVNQEAINTIMSVFTKLYS